MRPSRRIAPPLFLAIIAPFLVAAVSAPPDDVAAFEAYSGARLVFDRIALPPGDYYDRMPPVPVAKRARVAAIALREVRKYPPGFLGAIGLKVVGVFAACVDDEGDGFRPYDQKLKGYRYFGQWNGRDALVSAFYSGGQLPLTFHHEVFHHVDATVDGKVERFPNFAADDDRFRGAIVGAPAYAAPVVSAADHLALKARAEGYLLEGAVGAYASKSAGEDQAETARYLMDALPDALLQVVDQPSLPGSQRLLHILGAYDRALPDADFRWFVDVALDRADARRDLGELRRRARATDGDRRFVVWGAEEADGANPVLRADLGRVEGAAASARDIAEPVERTRAVLGALRLLGRYRAFIAASWSVTDGTEAAFRGARAALTDALPKGRRALATALRVVAWDDLTGLLDGETVRDARVTGRLVARGAAAGLPLNPYLFKVDDAVTDAVVRARIRSSQPATVRLGGGSGVNVAPEGRILTAAHVVDGLGRRMTARFPDGTAVMAVVTHLDAKLDLALLAIEGDADLPFVALAAHAPAVGDPVTVIGQPGSRTPDNQPTGYDAFTVSTGAVRGLRGDPLGSQRLGALMHDAWTYWGHSGSPLFDADGNVVGLHNSWDSRTAMRHAVPYQALAQFLGEAGVGAAAR